MVSNNDAIGFLQKSLDSQKKLIDLRKNHLIEIAMLKFIVLLENIHLCTLSPKHFNTICKLSK